MGGGAAGDAGMPLAQLIEGLRARVARARRLAVFIGVIGAAIGVVGTLTLLLADGATAGAAAAWSIAVGVSAGSSAAALGHIVGGGFLGSAVDDATGYDVSAERIRRAIRGESEILTTEEGLRAQRAAEVASVVLPAQRTRSFLVTVGLTVAWIALLVAGLATGRTDSVVICVIGLATAGLSAARIPMIARQAAAARLFLARTASAPAR